MAHDTLSLLDGTRFSGRSLGRRCAARLMRVWMTYVRLRRAQQQAAEIAALDDRMLRDIGLSRSMLAPHWRSDLARERRVSS